MGSRKYSGHICSPFPRNPCGPDPAGGGHIILAIGESKPQGWERRDLIMFLKCPFATCADCAHIKADSCVIKGTEMISLNGLQAPGFFPNDFSMVIITHL